MIKDIENECFFLWVGILSSLGRLSFFFLPNYFLECASIMLSGDAFYDEPSM